MAHLGAFLVLSLIVIAIPGPDTAVTLKNSLYSRRSGILTGFGVVSGLAIWTIAASAGVAAVVAASEPLFVALRIAGGAYLAFLGLQMLVAAVRREPHGVSVSRASITPVGAYRQGLLSDLGNPKIAVFFTSFLPQFTSSGQPAFWSLLALGAIFCSMTLVWLVAYASGPARVAELLRQGRIRRTIDALSGVVLVGFGLRLAIDRS